MYVFVSHPLHGRHAHTVCAVLVEVSTALFHRHKQAILEAHGGSRLPLRIEGMAGLYRLKE